LFDFTEGLLITGATPYVFLGTDMTDLKLRRRQFLHFIEEHNHMRSNILSAIIVLAITASFGGAGAQDAGKKVISTPNAPEAIGPYSQAIQVGKTVYVAGQIAIDPKTKQLTTNGSIEGQTRLVLENIAAILAAAGLTLDHVVSTTVFLKDLNEFPKVNDVYGTFFKNAPPARATVEVARLPRDVKVEISAIAVQP
jgi:2-iminobutanoate/2-iminopropanoate deaminase